MSITVDLTPIEEERLSNEALENGLAPGELVRNLLREHWRIAPEGAAGVVRAKLHQWQKETETKTAPAIPARELFGSWAEEDEAMTDEEKEAEDRLWQDFERGVNENRSALGMREL